MFTRSEIADYAKTVKAAFDTSDQLIGSPADAHSTFTGAYMLTGSLGSLAAENGDPYGRDFPIAEPVLWMEFDFSDSVSCSAWCRLEDALDPLSLILTADPLGDPEGSEGI